MSEGFKTRDSYLDRFPRAQRANVDRAYQDGFEDGANSQDEADPPPYSGLKESDVAQWQVFAGTPGSIHGAVCMATRWVLGDALTYLVRSANWKFSTAQSTWAAFQDGSATQVHKATESSFTLLAVMKNQLATHGKGTE